MDIAIIVPAWQEAANLSRLLPQLWQLDGADRLIREIIICDGGSGDQTLRVAREHGARVVLSPRGRGTQLRAGAQEARADVLWFLHADARPHPRALAAIEKACRAPQVWGGTFRLAFDAPGLWPRGFEAIARVQRRVGISYGDAGLWLRRAVYHELCGFAPWPLFEDYDLARRLERHARRHKARTVRLMLPLWASPRRFGQHPARLLRRWAMLQFLFWLGVSPHRLARMYKPHGN